MARGLRRTLWAVAGAQAALALGFALELEWALELWPFGGGRSRTSSSARSSPPRPRRRPGACCGTHRVTFIGIALDYVVILAPLGVYSLARAAGGIERGAAAAAFGVACLIGAAFGLVLLRAARGSEWRDERPAPRPVLWSFGLFAVVLLLVSGALLARVAVLPWPVTGDQSTAIGLMFLGAAAYFLYGLLRPRWENSGGQLAGFLAYDLVLIGPFLDRLPGVAPELRTELAVYTAVVVYSTLLAAWYLIFARGTRGAPDAVHAAAS